MKTICSLLLLCWIANTTFAAEFHVSPAGDNANDGSSAKPLKTISKAAELAQPGDVVTVHEGTYRERITPPRGGASDAKRIVYQAAPGEKAVIKGSEIIRDWKPFKPGVWKVTLPNSFFGNYNPYKDLIEGDWFSGKGRPHHTGEVYLNGKSLFETHLMDNVLTPKPFADSRDREASTWTWFSESDDTNTTLYANFHDKNPNDELVEINVRDSCFYPDQPGRDYLTIRGFRLCQAATQWAAPTAEQIGLIGTHWSKGWIIENNVISDSKCSGITLGKDRKTGHNVWNKDRSKDGSIHYNEVIVRALDIGWSRDKIGSHIVRNNIIFNCEQTGVCGSLGGAFSQITGNHIYNIWAKRQFTGAEMGGIKIHASIDMLIKYNRIHNTGRGMWMDWMAQGTRITGNLCYDNTTDDLYMEVDHGPYLVDNNIFLSDISLFDMSEGGAFAHNLLTGRIVSFPERNRITPWHQAHSTALGGLKNITGGDNRFFNNLLISGPGGDGNDKGTGRNRMRIAGFGLWMYDTRDLPLLAGGNVYCNGAKPYAKEPTPAEQAALDPKVQVLEEADGVYLQMTLDETAKKAATKLVTTDLLGKTQISGLPFENPDGTPLSIDTDYFGKARDKANPSAGPFENPGTGKLKPKVWPLVQTPPAK